MEKRVSILLVGKRYMVVASPNLLTKLLLPHTAANDLRENLTMEIQFKPDRGDEMEMVHVNWVVEWDG